MERTYVYILYLHIHIFIRGNGSKETGRNFLRSYTKLFFAFYAHVKFTYNLSRFVGIRIKHLAIRIALLDFVAIIL